MPRYLPNRLVVGDSLNISFSYESELDFGANPVVSLNVKTSAGVVRTIAGTYVDQEWTVDVTGTETATWSGGTAIYQVKLSSADGTTVVTIDSDIIILDDPLNTDLSPDELALKTLEDIRQYRLTNHQTTVYYMIGGDRQVQLMPLKELSQEIERLRHNISMKRNRGRFVRHRL